MKKGKLASKKGKKKCLDGLRKKAALTARRKKREIGGLERRKKVSDNRAGKKRRGGKVMWGQPAQPGRNRGGKKKEGHFQCGRGGPFCQASAKAPK